MQGTGFPGKRKQCRSFIIGQGNYHVRKDLKELTKRISFIYVSYWTQERSKGSWRIRTFLSQKCLALVRIWDCTNKPLGESQHSQKAHIYWNIVRNFIKETKGRRKKIQIQFYYLLKALKLKKNDNRNKIWQKSKIKSSYVHAHKHSVKSSTFIKHWSENILQFAKWVPIYTFTLL